MKRTFMHMASMIALLAGCAASGASQDITGAERGKALNYLGETRDGLAEAVKGLSPAQWNFKPAPDRWSVAEIVEHLAVLEDTFVHGLCLQLAHAPAGTKDRDVKKVDAIILAKVPDRTTKIQAPASLVPMGRWAPRDALARFVADREKTVNFLTSESNLRGHVLAHPVLGPLDAYEWVLAVAAHTERHTKQILEVKADPHFPLD